MSGSHTTQQDAAEEHPLALIFSTHRQSFITAAERIIGSRNHAEDIVHDAFVKIVGAPITTSMRSQTSYLMTVVRNLAIDHYRRRHIESDLMASEEEGLNVITPDAASPESLSQQRETLKTLAGALAELPQRTRYAFEMHRIHGFSQKDIAITLGVSPTLVNFMIRDALVHCRKTLQDKQVVP